MANSTASVRISMFPPPPGVTPNFTNPESIAYRLVLAAVICPVVTLPFLFCRLYTKRVVLKHVRIDDYTIAFSFLWALIFSILNVLQTRNGAGLHIWDVTLDKSARFMYMGQYAAIAYGMCTLLVKISILIFYLRLSTPVLRFKLTIYGVMFVVMGYSLTSAFAFLYTCQPIRKLWHFTTPGKCVNLGDLFLAHSALNVATDFAIFLLPIWVLWPLTLPLRRKIGVTLILMTGSLVVGISVIRLANIPLGRNDTDITWRYVTNLVWCIIEMYAGIVCACLPSLKSFTKHHFPKMFPEHIPEPVLHSFTGVSEDFHQQLDSGAGQISALWSENTSSTKSVSLRERPSNPSIWMEDQKEENVFIADMILQRPENTVVARKSEGNTDDRG